MRVLVTGAGGHVGGALLPALTARGHAVKALSRRPLPRCPDGATNVVATLDADSDLAPLLADVDAVIHLADGFNAYEQLPRDASVPEAERRLLTLQRLAEAAARRQLRLVYLSTIKAMCGTQAETVLTEDTPPRPQSLYGRLKLEAEQHVARLVAERGGSALVLRFPIVFGTGRGDGNLERLLRLADTPWPLPLKGLTARRSFISAETLIAAAVLGCERPITGARTFLLHDGAMTVEELLRTMRRALGRDERLFALPAPLWRAAESLPRIGRIAERFTRPLEVDDRRFRTAFDWQPARSLEAMLEDMVRQHVWR
jgi:UDP-glucose 4-epimerase